MTATIPGVVPVAHPGGTYSTEGPQCPHCGRQFVADDPGYFDDMNYTEETCDACGGEFTVRVYTETSWTCDFKE